MVEKIINNVIAKLDGKIPTDEIAKVRDILAVTLNDYEFTSKSDLQKCYDFVCHIIENCTKKYECEYFRRSCYNFFGHSHESGDDNQYWLDFIHDEINDYLSFYEDAEFEEVLDDLSYNGLTDNVDYCDIVRIYYNVKAELKEKSELEEV